MTKIEGTNVEWNDETISEFSNPLPRLHPRSP